MDISDNKRYQELRTTSVTRPQKQLLQQEPAILPLGKSQSEVDSDTFHFHNAGNVTQEPIHRRTTSYPGSGVSPAVVPREEFQQLSLGPAAAPATGTKRRAPSEGAQAAVSKRSSNSPPRRDQAAVLDETNNTNPPAQPEVGRFSERYVSSSQPTQMVPRPHGGFNATGGPQANTGGPQILLSPKGPRDYSARSSGLTSPQESALSPSSTQTLEPGRNVEALVPSEAGQTFSMLKQPDSRPISHNQLAAEVKGIYAGLVMVETKCVNVVNAQASALRAKQSGDPSAPPLEDHWHALIALHRSLLHEHHDFFLASQHPSASPALRELASKYSMPARMWKHGIHNFLELLRHRLPASLDYMLAFIYLAYQMMALLYETVTSFEDTWIECLGDLARYRMAIEDEDLRDREIWTGVARYWYCKAVDKNPMIGRLYHHLAILARTHPLQQLALYSRSLIAVSVFTSTRESIMTLFEPILARTETCGSRPPSVDIYFAQCHALVFTDGSRERFENAFAKLMSQLDPHIGRVTMKWKEQGMYMAISSFCAMFEFGSPDSPLRISFSEKHGFHDTDKGQSPTRTPLVQGQFGSPYEYQAAVVEMVKARLQLVLRVFFSVLDVALRRVGDLNVLPHVHLDLVFFLTLTANVEYGFLLLSTTAPWQDMAMFLNSLIKPEQFNYQILNDAFITPPPGESRVLPEDWMLRGQIYCWSFLPEQWFDGATADEDERTMEHASTARLRVDRVLWLAVRLANLGVGKYPDHPWLAFDSNEKLFSVRSTVPTA